jgi:hypothetical protein
MALPSFGVILEMGDGEDPEVFTEIAGVSSLSGPSLSVDTEDVTAHDSPGGYEEAVATIIRTGEVSMELFFDPGEASHDALKAVMFSRLPRNFVLYFPDHPTKASRTRWSFSAFVTALSPTFEVSGAIGASVTLKLHGQPTLQ